MSIHKLPEYLTDRLATGQIIHQPASVIKELVENSLDAGATTIKIDIRDGGKSYISVEDDGSGIELSDMDFLFQNFSTSKINGEQDVFNLKSYGFRGEALASIAQFGKITLISKTAYSEIGTKITKIGIDPIIKHQPVGFDHGTVVTVENLFHNSPEKLASLKSSQTEFFYCYNYIVDIALIQYDKTFVFKKNDKVIFDLQPRGTLVERIADIYKKDRSKRIKYLTYDDDEIVLRGVIGDPQLSFGSAENIKIYVDKRPVQDSSITKAIMDVYHKKLLLNEYPLAIIEIETKKNIVDVNKHPQKMEIIFSDSKKIYDVIYNQIQESLSGKIIASIPKENVTKEASTSSQPSIRPAFIPQESALDQQIGEYIVIGQIRNSYIILQSPDAIYYVDQYLLAQKILFENMKKSLSGSISSEILLQPIMIPVTNILDLDQKLDQLTSLGFDVSMVGENKVAMYSIPQVFSVYQIDMEKVFNHIMMLETITFATILQKIFSSHSYKTAIQAGDKLSLSEMVTIIKDGFATIPDMIYKKPGELFIKMEKKDMENEFSR